MIRYLDLYWISLKYNLKSLYEYRFDFWVGLVSFIILQGVGLFFIWMLYQFTPGLAGWSLDQVIFIYGLQEVVKSLYLVFFGSTTGLEQLIRRGNFDRFLVRPESPLFQLVISKINFKGIGSLIVAIGILTTAIRRVGFQLSLANLFLLALFLLTGALIYFSLALITSTSAFWMTRTMRLHQLVFDFSEFTRYPIDIFHQGLQLILSVVIPFALASYYPAKYFLQGGVAALVLLQVMGGALIFFLVAYRFWSFGVNYYHSTGS